jgi:hypothetical protein
MDTDNRLDPTHRISGPDELLHAVPYLLGFHPERSLVLMGLHRQVLVVTARLDLADAAEEGTLAHAIGAMARGGSTAIVAAAFDESASIESSMSAAAAWPHLTAAIEREAARIGCELLDAMLVVGERWRSLLCDSPDCCPPGGRTMSTGPSAFAAAATYEGVVALADRAELEAVLDPDPDGVRARLGAALEVVENDAVTAVLDGHMRRHRRSVIRALFAAARESAEPGWSGLDDAAVARFGAALPEIAVRDAVWMAVDDGRIDGRPLWRDLARRLPAPYDAPPLFLFGWASWRAGDGALAGIAAERAVRSDGEYSAADLLLAALDRGVDPRQLPRLRQRRSA